MIKKGEGGSALVNVLKHPITVGTLGGAAIGGGMGYIASQDKDRRVRDVLTGAGSGAILGGLGGAVASTGLNPDEVASVTNDANNLGYQTGYNVAGRAAQQSRKRAVHDSMYDGMRSAVSHMGNSLNELTPELIREMLSEIAEMKKKGPR